MPQELPLAPPSLWRASEDKSGRGLPAEALAKAGHGVRGQLSSPSVQARSRIIAPRMLAAGLTIFLGAFLLFQVEPLLAKAILPWFGGAPAVWTTCMVFFQVALLAGYLYAHAIVRRFSQEGARRLHLFLVFFSLATLVAPLAWGNLPLLPSAAWKPPDPANPIGRIVALLATHVGLPFLLLSSTSPLLSAWIARARTGAPVYRLYAASNLGSLLALVTYPPLVERFLPLPSQALVWTAAFALFALGTVFCLWRYR